MKQRKLIQQRGGNDYLSTFNVDCSWKEALPGSTEKKSNGLILASELHLNSDSSTRMRRSQSTEFKFVKNFLFFFRCTFLQVVQLMLCYVP